MMNKRLFISLLMAVTAVTAIQAEDYALNFDPNTITNPNSNQSLSVVIVVDSDNRNGQLNIPVNERNKIYHNYTDRLLFVTSGATITPRARYNTQYPMHAYFYIDYNQDGKFEVEIGADRRPSVSSELVSYTWLNGYNSHGVQTTENTAATINLPTVTLPESLPMGVYRARLKIDTNCADPGGRYGAQYTDSLIDQRGGAIIDLLLNISDGKRVITPITENGNIYSGANGGLPLTVRPGRESLSLQVAAVKPGYVLSKLQIKRGLNLEGDSLVRGNRQWYLDDIKIPANTEQYNLQFSANEVVGDLIVTALFTNRSSEYALVWSDEFNAANGTAPNKTYWTSSPRLTSTWSRYITDTIDVAFQHEGELKLRAIPNLDQVADNVPMLTGAIQSRGKYFFQHGRMECRAKVNPFIGNFPAIWMMPQDRSVPWPDCGEIDVMEQINSENRSFHTIHSRWSWTLGHRHDAFPATHFTKNLDMSLYHVYALEWELDTLKWFVDGVQVGYYGREPQNEADGQWPFDKPFYIILNQSVGDGSWASKPDVSHTYEMAVDWVRVYQKKTITHVTNELQEDTIRFSVSKNTLTIRDDGRNVVRVYDCAGLAHFIGVVEQEVTLSLPRGLYLINGRKVIVP